MHLTHKPPVFKAFVTLQITSVLEFCMKLKKDTQNKYKELIWYLLNVATKKPADTIQDPSSSVKGLDSGVCSGSFNLTNIGDGHAKLIPAAKTLKLTEKKIRKWRNQI